jgi:hypothetical protein
VHQRKLSAKKKHRFSKAATSINMQNVGGNTIAESQNKHKIIFNTYERNRF